MSSHNIFVRPREWQLVAIIVENHGSEILRHVIDWGVPVVLDVGTKALDSSPAYLKILLSPSFLVDSQTVKDGEKLRHCFSICEIEECISQVVTAAEVQWCVEKIEPTTESPLFDEIEDTQLALTVRNVTQHNRRLGDVGLGGSAWQSGRTLLINGLER